MRKLLFVLAASTMLLASCGGSSSQPGSQPQADTKSDAASASNTRVRTSSTPADESESTDESESAEEASSNTRVRPSSSSSRPTEAALPDTLPTIEGTNTFFRQSVIKADGEGVAVGDRGFVYVWSGDGGVATPRYANGEYRIDYAMGWAWYGVQVFYKLPYSEAGDAYKLRLTLHSDIEGRITLNGNAIDLVWGWNVITLDVTEGNGASLNMQFGVNGGDSADSTMMAGQTIRIKDIEFYDAVNTYHNVKFVNGEETVKDIQVRAGKTVTAPSLSIPEDKLFVGWFDGENEFDEKAAVNAAATYVAKIVDKSSVTTHKVQFMLGSHLVAEADVVENATATFNKDLTPLGYTILGWYTDAELTAEYTNAPVTANLTLYAKANVTPSTYFHNGQIASQESAGKDGEYFCNLKDHGYDQGWNIQFNFSPLPVSDASKTYSITVEYRVVGAVTGSVGNIQLYDSPNNASVAGSNAELACDNDWHSYSFEYAGDAFSSSTKLTFELGLVHPADAEAGMDFGLRGFWIDVK